MKEGQQIVAKVDITTDILFGDGGDIVKVPSGTHGTVTEGEVDGIVRAWFANGCDFYVIAESIHGSPIMALDQVVKI